MSYGNGKLPPDFGGAIQQSLFETRVYKSAGVEQILNSGILYSGQDYQRPVSQRDVDELVQLWDEALFEPPIVSYRKGKYHLVDGQRRVSAIRQMNGGEEERYQEFDRKIGNPNHFRCGEYVIHASFMEEGPHLGECLKTLEL